MTVFSLITSLPRFFISRVSLTFGSPFPIFIHETCIIVFFAYDNLAFDIVLEVSVDINNICWKNVVSVKDTF